MRSLVVVIMAGFILAVAGAANAQPDYNEPDVVLDDKMSVPDTVQGLRFRQPPPPAVIPQVQMAPPEVEAGLLPFTGAQLSTFVLGALAAIGSGLMLLRRSRAS